MKSDKIKTEHITLALKDFKDKGFPEGFKAFAYFDIEIEGALYPPKPMYGLCQLSCYWRGAH